MARCEQITQNGRCTKTATDLAPNPNADLPQEAEFHHLCKQHADEAAERILEHNKELVWAILRRISNAL